MVFCIYEDQFGILWIGTGEGINRYDGYTFKSYNNDPDDSTSLGGNQIFDIMEDSDGILWVGTNAGLSRFDRNSESFENFLVDSTSANQESQQVVSLLEDSEGYIWVGAIANNLKRFDKKLNRIVDIEPKLESGEVLAIPAAVAFVEADDGALYFGFFNYGLARYYEYNQTLQLLASDDPEYEAIFKGNLVLALDIDNNNNLWTSYNGGLVSYNLREGTIEKIKLPDYSHDQTNLSSFKLRVFDGRDVWVGTNGAGVYKYSSDTKEVLNFRQKGNLETGLKSNSVFDIHKDSFGDIWISTVGGGIAKYNVDKEPFRVFKIPVKDQSGQNFNPVTAIYQYSENEILTGTQNGLFIMDMKSAEAVEYNAGDEFVRCIFKYDSDEYWLGTSDGVKAFSVNKNRLLNSRTVNEINKNFKSTIIKNIFTDSLENIWIASSGTLLRFNRSDNSIMTINTKQRRSYSDELTEGMRRYVKKSKPFAHILEVGEDQQITKKFHIDRRKKMIAIAGGEGTVQPRLFDFGWITNSNGDTVWSIQDYTKTFHLGGSLKNRLRFDIIEFIPGEYFLNYQSDVGHSYGNWNEEAPPDSNWWGIQVIEFDEDKEGYLSELISSENDYSFIDATIINKLIESEIGVLWAATNDGITMLDPVTFQTKKYSGTTFNDRGFVNNVINDIVEDKDSILWLASSGGLIRFDHKTESALSLTTEDGLPSSQIVSVLRDEYENLWMGSLNGLIKFDKSSFFDQPYFVNYDVKDGLQGYLFNARSTYKSDEGRLFFGGNNGFNAFFPGRINRIPPKIAIDGFYISNKYITTISENSPLTKNILETEELILPYSQNDISFSFAAIHYLRPERNKLAYMMEGLDTGWVYDNRRYAAFTNLDPGDYKFKVKGANSDGIWNDEVRTVAITVLPPWYRTTLAYIIYGILFVLAFVGFDRLQRKRILTKERERQRIQEAELRALAAEAEAKVIQAENERKTKELEEARELQLSMLPAELPQLPHLDIAVYMKTATEVGGDYYDFHIGMDGTLTCVIGDATGHGLNAGTMVTATKSLFSTHASNNDILFTFDEISRCLKSMRMRLLSMCLQIAKIRGNELTISSAGMPPALLYRAGSKKVEELLMRGMPLGAPASIPYEVKNTTLNSGDTLLLLSDGFPELFNSQKEMYGYDRVMETFNKLAHQEAAEIIDSLKEEGSNYVEGRDPDDDVTFVVIKVK